jgi:hypothetical protein
MIQRISKDAFILWQVVEEGVGEPAILIRRYNDVLEFQQEKRTILINVETVEEFIKAIRKTMKKEKNGEDFT